MADINNYVKIHEAVQAFCEWSLPSIEACIRQWHQNKQMTLLPCQQPSTCPSYKKPTAKSNACKSCIDWGSAVEAELFKRQAWDEFVWRNVNATILHKDALEVAKGFVFILPNRGQTCARFTDFDVGGILKMMMGFRGYHHGDQICVDKIQKIVDIRNGLSHMKVDQQMQIPDARTSDYFVNIRDLVTDLEGRHAGLGAHKIRTRLDEIQYTDVTQDRIAKAVQPLTDEIKNELKEIKEKVSRLEPNQSDRQTGDQFLQMVKKQLVSEYKHTRNRMQILPGVAEEHDSMEKAVTLEFSTMVNVGGITYWHMLENYDSFVRLRDDQEQIVKRILIKGNPACGKSTLMSKLAYDWAKNDASTSAYAKFQLLFVLDIKEITPGDDLFDAIQKQVLPTVSKEALKTYVASHAESVLFLFDGYDEAPVSFPRDHPDFAALLSSRLFPESFVILTTRPHKVAEIINKCVRACYAQFELLGLSRETIFQFIADNFDVWLGHVDWVNRGVGPFTLPTTDRLKNKPPPNLLKTVESVASLIAKLAASDQLLEICRCPMFLKMLCFLWEKQQDVSLILTSLFFEAVMLIAKNRWEVDSDGEIDGARVRQHVKDVLLKLGKVALDGMMENRLFFRKSEFDDAILNDAYKVGLVLKERGRSKLEPVSYITFIHKTFQEMSAAYYWASLVDAKPEVFNEYLTKYLTGSDIDELMLRFCCGNNVKAAKVIIQQVVELSCLQWEQMKESGDDKCFLGQYYKGYDPWRLALLLLFEADYHLDPHESQQLHCLLHRLVSRLEIEANCHESVSEVWTILKEFGQNAESEPNRLTWLDLVEEVYIADKTGGKGSKMMGRSQFLQQDPAIAVAVPCMTNLKSLVIDGSSGTNCTCLLQNMITNCKASTKLTTFVCRAYNFESQVMANFLSHQKALSVLDICKGVSVFGKVDKVDPKEARMVVQAVVDGKTSPMEVLILVDFPLSNYVSCLKPQMQHLKELQLSRVYTKGSNNGTSIFEMISVLKRELPLVKLSLQGSNKEGAGKSMAVAVKYLPKLECLNLWHGFNKEEPGLDEQDFKDCGPELGQLRYLTELDLGGNNIGNSMKELGQGLQYLKELQSLVLYHTKLTEESVEFLPLDCLPNLTKLALGSNKFGKGIARLSEKLKFLTDMRDFELSRAGLTDEDVALLPLSSFPHLISLDLNSNDLWSDGLCVIAQQLEHMPLLRTLRLSEHRSMDTSEEVVRGIRHVEGVVALLQSIHYVPNLVSFWVPHIFVRSEDISQSSYLAAYIRCQILNTGNFWYNGKRYSGNIQHNGKCYKKYAVTSDPHSAQNTSSPVKAEHGGSAQNTSSPMKAEHGGSAQNTSSPVKAEHAGSAQNTSSPVKAEHGGSAQNTSSPVKAEHGGSAQNTSSPVKAEHGGSAQNTSSPVKAEHGSSVQKTSSPVKAEHGGSAQNTSSPVKAEHGGSAQKTRSPVKAEHGGSAQKTSSPVKAEHGGSVQKTSSPVKAEHGGSAQKTSSPVKAEHGGSAQKTSSPVKAEHGSSVQKTSSPVKAEHGGSVQKTSSPVKAEHGGSAQKTSSPVKAEHGGSVQKTSSPVKAEHGGSAQKTSSPVKAEHGSSVQKTSSPVKAEHGGSAQTTSSPVKAEHGGSVQKTSSPVKAEHGGSVQKTSSPVKAEHGGSVQKTSLRLPMKAKHGSSAQKTSSPMKAEYGGSAQKTSLPMKAKHGSSAQKTSSPMKAEHGGSAQKTGSPIKAEHGGNARFVHKVGQWLRFDGFKALWWVCFLIFTVCTCIIASYWLK